MEAKTQKRSRVSHGAVRSEETHRAIVEAAAEILEESGYAGFTLDAVVKRAGSSKPSIYRWWKNKAALIIEVYERSGESGLVTSEKGNLRDELAGFLTALWHWWRATRAGEALRSIVAEAQSDPQTLELLRDEFVDRRKNNLRVILQRACERGELRPDAEIEAAISLAMGASWLHMLTGTLEDTRLCESYSDMLVRALNARQGTSC